MSKVGTYFVSVLNKTKLLQFFNLENRVIINNRPFRIPLIGKMGMENTEISEPWMVQLLQQLTKNRKEKLYVDVGVNTGQTMIKLKSVAPNMPYLGFEPNPACLYYVDKLVRLNCFEKVQVLPVGVSGTTAIQQLTFFSDESTDSSATILQNFRPGQQEYRKVYIPCFAPSDVFQQIPFPPIGILKIDVEGAEKEVLEGFAHKIEIDQPFIQLEILPVYSADNTDRWSRQQAIEQLFKTLNYVMFRIHRNKQDQLARLERIEHIGIHSNLDWCEYLVAPSCEAQSLLADF